MFNHQIQIKMKKFQVFKLIKQEMKRIVGGTESLVPDHSNGDCLTSTEIQGWQHYARANNLGKVTVHRNPETNCAHTITFEKPL